jgi:hypothetical protein
MSEMTIARTPGDALVYAVMGIPFDYHEAEKAGAFEEEALSFHDAMDATAVEAA